MLRRNLLKIVPAVFALALVPLLSAAMPAVLGPPWISIEYPPSPYDETTRDAYLLVHAFHHGTPMNFPVSGNAEGIVKGERRTVKLDFARTSRTGVYALKKQWPEDGTWMLVITATQAPGDGATAMVEIGSNGQVAAVRVPTSRDGRWSIPSKVTARDIDSALQARLALNGAEERIRLAAETKRPK